MMKSLSIRFKLALLAGVPVLGALALALLLWMRANKESQTAAALGSVEDLAELSATISDLVHELQTERAWLGLALGHRIGIKEALLPSDAEPHRRELEQAKSELSTQYEETDRAHARLVKFLNKRRLSDLPPRLQHSLQTAQTGLTGLEDFRKASLSGEGYDPKQLEFFTRIHVPLIGATASLTRLTDDGEMLRSITALVSLMQLTEGVSQEHTVLSTVFAAGAFPPGTYRELVTLVTEQEVYVEVFESNSGDTQLERFRGARQSPPAQKALAMRKEALAATEDEFESRARNWFEAQSEKLRSMARLESDLTRDLQRAALAKLEDIEASRRFSLGLSGAVLLLSTLLASLIARGVTRSVRALGKAAERVRENKDYSARAEKLSHDELGQLTDAFNEMLSGIQSRDDALEEHRQNLERRVRERTSELSARNEAMRVVLDNVDQGLATIQRDGSFAEERSRAFDDWFGSDAAQGSSFSKHLSGHDSEQEAMLRLGWDEVVEGFMPLELTIEQMPKKLTRDGRHYALAYKPMGAEDAVEGALLVVSDVTEHVQRIAEEARQREFLSVFEKVMKDRNGFIEFFNEAERLTQAAVSLQGGPALVVRNVHTIKGNAGLHGVQSIVEACHKLETEWSESGKEPNAEQMAPLEQAWTAFSERVRALIGEEREGVVELSQADFDALVASVRRRVAYGELAQQLERLQSEPVEKRFERIADQAESLARRLGKPLPQVHIDAGEVRLSREGWAPFWSAFAHILRNAIDHGLETSEERCELGKEQTPHLWLRARREAGRLSLELEDDGRGIDWERVSDKAEARGLPNASRADLVNALFSDGLSTHGAATDLSGRGVGMSAVRQATEALRGSIEMHSPERGKGTRVRLVFPLSAAKGRAYESNTPCARPSLLPRSDVQESLAPADPANDRKRDTA